MGKTPDEWSYGDVDAGFKSAALVLDETFVTPDTSHQTLEPRTALAYWQNGKVFVHMGTQSTVQTLAALGRWLNMDPNQIVLISEYTGGGFGSKATGYIFAIIPALLSKKANAPVMMRISREEEHFIGRARPGFQGRMKVGFSKEGRITALDMFAISDNGPYDAQGDADASGIVVSLLYQPQAMRWRGVTVLTNTPPRSPQSSPGGMQGIAIIEPILAKAARKLGVDQVDIRRINCPEGKAPYGPPVQGKRQHATSAFLKEALDRGAEQFKWKERVARSPKRIGSKGARRRRIAQLLRRRHYRIRRTFRYHARWPGPVPVRNRQPGNGVGDRRPPRGSRKFSVSRGKSAMSPGAILRRTCRGPASPAAARPRTR